jgi:hypothetical protein
MQAPSRGWRAHGEELEAHTLRSGIRGVFKTDMKTTKRDVIIYDGRIFGLHQESQYSEHFIFEGETQ